MSLVSLLEDLAEDTWERVRDGFSLGVRQGETTITDILLLELKRANLPGLIVKKTPPTNEPAFGTDWEWWIGSDQSGWMRFAVQAKKLYLDKRTYSALGHKLNGQLQIDALKQYAHAVGAVPLYCLYNYCGWTPLHNYWHCTQPLDAPQLGCTVTSLPVARQAVHTRGARSFESVHLAPATIPWRCLVRCPHVRVALSPGTPVGHAAAIRHFGETPRIYDHPPEALLAPGDTLEEFPAGFYDHVDLPFKPRRVVILDLAEEELAPVVEQAD